MCDITSTNLFKSKGAPALHILPSVLYWTYWPEDIQFHSIQCILIVFVSGPFLLLVLDGSNVH